MGAKPPDKRPAHIESAYIDAPMAKGKHRYVRTKSAVINAINCTVGILAICDPDEGDGGGSIIEQDKTPTQKRTLGKTTGAESTSKDSMQRNKYKF
jgi:hypothetical protein